VQADQCYRLDAPAVAAQIDEAEAILIHFDSGSYYTLNALGTEILQRLIEARRSARDIAIQLARRYDANDDALTLVVRDFIQRLFDERLVTPDDASPSLHSAPDTTLPTSEPRLPLVGPELTKYSDLEDLLKLDPIHDVDEAGWPVARPAP